MRAVHIITAMSAAILLAGCGNVDAPLEKKNVASTTTTSFTFSFSTSSEGDVNGGDVTVTGADGKTTTKKKAAKEELVSTTLTAATTPEPTTTSTTTTTTTTTTAAPRPTETTPAETTKPTETTTTFFDPNNQLINTFDLTEIKTVAYNGIQFTVGDRMSDVIDSLGDPILEPIPVTSIVSGGTALEHHYKMLTIISEGDMITSIELARTEVNPELEPYLTWGIRFGQPIGEIISFLGNAYQLTDPQTLMYSDGSVKLLFYAPNETIEKITVRL